MVQMQDFLAKKHHERKFLVFVHSHINLRKIGSTCFFAQATPPHRNGHFVRITYGVENLSAETLSHMVLSDTRTPGSGMLDDVSRVCAKKSISNWMPPSNQKNRACEASYKSDRASSLRTKSPYISTGFYVCYR